MDLKNFRLKGIENVIHLFHKIILAKEYTLFSVEDKNKLISAPSKSPIFINILLTFK